MWRSCGNLMHHCMLCRSLDTHPLTLPLKLWQISSDIPVVSFVDFFLGVGGEGERGTLKYGTLAREKHVSEL